MAIRFTTTGDAARLSGVKILVYGRAGTGKTTLCATAPTPVIISAEAGLLSLARHAIPVIEVSSTQDFSDAYRWATESREAASFETICLDSISEIAERILDNAKKQVKDPRQAYGELIEKTRDMVKAFRDLKGKHIYFAAKEEYDKNEMGVMRFQPSMPGSKLGPQLPYFFDEVFNLGIAKTPTGQEYRFLKTHGDFQYEAKDRSGALDPVEEPNLTTVINKILRYHGKP